MNDLDRARDLGMSIEQFQSLVGFDPLESHLELVQGLKHGGGDKSKKTKKKENKENKEEKAESTAGGPQLSDNFNDIGDGTMIPFETDEDVRNKNAEELENYWPRPVTSSEDKALYYGFHIHSKDNIYGLHAHYPGGPLGGSHDHGAQNKLGYHTHRYSLEELQQFRFARPGIMIQLDGPHIHQNNAPDGKHNHAEENFGPAKS